MGTPGPRKRLPPEDRREQLLDHGLRLLADRSIDELTIDLLAEEAGISRGLLYHYFGTKRDFHRAVVQRAADDLYARTEPTAAGRPAERLRRSVEAFVDYVLENHAMYTALLRAAGSGREDLAEIRGRTRVAMADRVFTAAWDVGLAGVGIDDTPAARMLAVGWSAMVETVTLDWIENDRGLGKAQLVAILAEALPAVMQGLNEEG